MRQERKMRDNSQSESGMVSILTVIFFMVFISILVVSFIRLISDEQRQATDNDLSASALAAAQNGIEDAKRIIMYCSKDGPSGGNKNACDTIMNSGDTGNCDTFKSGGDMNGFRNALKIGDMTTAGDVIVSTNNNETFQQYYTCLTISQNTPSIKKLVQEGGSMITPLRTVSGFDSLKISWASQKDVAASYTAGTATLGAFKPVASWNSGGTSYPPVLRLQFIPYIEGSNLDLDALDRESRTLFVVPTSSTDVAIIGASDLAVDSNRNNTPGQRRTSGGVPIVFGKCDTTATNYACSKIISGFDAGMLNKRYYLRSSLLYSNDRQSELTIEPFNGATSVKFDNVQPLVDVTGRTNDVFRRVRAYVSFAPPVIALPEYAIESVSPICKDMIVADAANSQYLCP